MGRGNHQAAVNEMESEDLEFEDTESEDIATLLLAMYHTMMKYIDPDIVGKYMGLDPSNYKDVATFLEFLSGYDEDSGVLHIFVKALSDIEKDKSQNRFLKEEKYLGKDVNQYCQQFVE